MDFITENFFLILLLIGGAVSQWIKSRSEASKEESPHEKEYEPVMPQRRRVVPPSLPPQRQVYFPPQFDAEAELARQAELSEKIKELQYAKRSQANSNQKSRNPEPEAAASSSSPRLSLRSSLKQRAELRKAFVLKEIFDKPLSLRSFSFRLER